MIYVKNCNRCKHESVCKHQGLVKSLEDTDIFSGTVSCEYFDACGDLPKEDQDAGDKMQKVQ